MTVGAAQVAKACGLTFDLDALRYDFKTMVPGEPNDGTGDDLVPLRVQKIADERPVNLEDVDWQLMQAPSVRDVVARTNLKSVP